MNLRLLILALIILGYLKVFSQNEMDSTFNLNTNYQPSKKRTIDITHTRLEVKPFFNKRSMDGKAFLSIKPYNSPISHFDLDAKGMNIKQVLIMDSSGTFPLKFEYNDLILSIHLQKVYNPDESFMLFIEYIAQPYELDAKGLSFSSGRGLFFIDPYDKNPFKDTQLWTTGETQSNSVWFPTVDSPNESFTQEISITVDEKYTTISNGILKNTIHNADGTKTDYWKQNIPHAPYLAMIAVSKFYKTVDKWGSLEVNYYTDSTYHLDAKKVFGNTPDMMTYFSSLLGVEFPWEKYAQVVVHELNFAAMENTSASLFYASYYADVYDALDRNYDDIIAHELMHQWFGDLITCESWANLALNESFATYGEYLWYDYKYGREEADYILHEYLNIYLDETIYKIEPIINYYFEDPDNDLFDAHRYEKGHAVLHLLRNYLGDKFFFEAIQFYLKSHKGLPVEIHDLRMDFEKISGEDLSWFFNQWFLQAGHPKVEINTAYDPSQSEITININQVQNLKNDLIFSFPLSIDIYDNNQTIRQEVWIKKGTESFTFKVSSEPDLINVDAKKIMLWEKKENKSVKELTYQFFNAPLYLDKLEALEGLTFEQDKNDAQKCFQAALKDSFWGIRNYAVEKIALDFYTFNDMAINQLKEIIFKDTNTVVRKNALINLGNFNSIIALPLCDSLISSDSSRLVLGSALKIVFQNYPDKAYILAKKFENIQNIYLSKEVAAIYAEKGNPSDHEFFKNIIWYSRSVNLPNITDYYKQFLEKMDIKTIKDAASFLKDIVLYEETDLSKTSAKNTLLELKGYFSNSKITNNEAKLSAINLALKELD